MTDSPSLPVLYILMRSDIASMNPGKLAAQASHAANAFVAHADLYPSPEFYAWQKTTLQSFGTVLVLDGETIDEIRELCHTFLSKNYVAGVIHDPTYPIVDGDTVHHIPLDTCGYIFVPDKHSDSFAEDRLSVYDLYA